MKKLEAVAKTPSPLSSSTASKELADCEAEKKTLQDSKTKLKSENSELTAKITDKEKEIATLKDKITDKDKEITAKEKEITAKDNDIKLKEIEITSLRSGNPPPSVTTYSYSGHNVSSQPDFEQLIKKFEAEKAILEANKAALEAAKKTLEAEKAALEAEKAALKNNTRSGYENHFKRNKMIDTLKDKIRMHNARFGQVNNMGYGQGLWNNFPNLDYLNRL